MKDRKGKPPLCHLPSTHSLCFPEPGPPLAVLNHLLTLRPLLWTGPYPLAAHYPASEALDGGRCGSSLASLLHLHTPLSFHAIPKKVTRKSCWLLPQEPVRKNRRNGQRGSHPSLMKRGASHLKMIFSFFVQVTGRGLGCIFSPFSVFFSFIYYPRSLRGT